MVKILEELKEVETGGLPKTEFRVHFRSWWGWDGGTISNTVGCGIHGILKVPFVSGEKIQGPAGPRVRVCPVLAGLLRVMIIKMIKELNRTMDTQ